MISQLLNFKITFVLSDIFLTLCFNLITSELIPDLQKFSIYYTHYYQAEVPYFESRKIKMEGLAVGLLRNPCSTSNFVMLNLKIITEFES